MTIEEILEAWEEKKRQAKEKIEKAGAGIDRELLSTVLRCVGISIVSRIGCDVCRDAGVSSAASYIELVAGAASVMCAAPLMLAVLRQIGM